MIKKIIAPIIITIILIFVELIYLGIYIALIPWIWLKIILAVIPLGSIGVTIYVLIERIHEVRSGEEDDLSQY
ncbi:MULTISPECIES: hypothetical protein [Anaerostipes]|uniref:hypothetical protein n=1 Tax=Anaerostipes TaxID=207244 RepID=UPI0009527237|nr:MULTISPECIES: hypothetical protein [Anaerostipes]MCI5622559.1 hypothetical protein [Anaerostipes sp.]MDY2725560.1 hypothetical protein [Anaerostipes faecalis]OLR59042.1 hypothetical protein BHF70_05030 [Anaerostipes sp. 494a]